MRHQPATPDQVVAAWAARQFGVLHVGQLRAAGLSPDAIKRRAAAGRLHRVHRAVYAVGHSRLGNEGRWLAAVLACGEGAALSHISAAEHLRMLDPRPGPVHVTVPGSGGRSRQPNLRIHCSSLPRSTVVRRNGIAVTTLARTLADLRRAVAGDVFRAALRQAELLGYDVGPAQTDRTRSELERRLLWLWRRHRIPQPEVNARVGRHVVDFLWRRHRLIVESDGWVAHRGRVAFETDRRRDRRLQLLGFRVLSFTSREVFAASGAVVTAIREPLAG